MIHVFRYSQIVGTNKALAIVGFMTKTGLSQEVIVEIVTEQEKVGGIIYRYKSGDIETPEFRSLMNNSIKNHNGSTLADEVFDSCWNSMCIVDPSKVPQGYDIHVIGLTNELHHRYIQETLGQLPISYTLSFTNRTLDISRLRELVKTSYENDESFEFYDQNSENAIDLLSMTPDLLLDITPVDSAGVIGDQNDNKEIMGYTGEVVDNS